MNATPLTEAQKALASDPDLIRLAKWRAAAFAARHGLRSLVDEFESEALKAICDAARTFDAGRGASFRTHALNRVNGSFLDVCRAAGLKGYRRDGTPPDRLPLTFDRPNEDLPVGWEVESQDEIVALSRSLPVQGREAVRLYYGRAGATMKAVGEVLGVCESRVSQVVAESIEFLGEHLRAS